VISGDSKRLTQLVQNLVSNSMDAMPDGGAIQIHLLETNAGICLKVVDEGDGISRDVADSLFEPFVTTKASGLGLGLSICQEVAREHDAQFTLRNRTDARGAIAEVIFPAAGAPVGQPIINDMDDLHIASAASRDLPDSPKLSPV
jgi:signal transduction histidine kinase